MSRWMNGGVGPTDEQLTKVLAQLRAITSTMLGGSTSSRVDDVVTTGVEIARSALDDGIDAFRRAALIEIVRVCADIAMSEDGIFAALAKLSYRDRAALVLVNVADLPVTEAAAVLGIGEKDVAEAVDRGTKALEASGVSVGNIA